MIRHGKPLADVPEKEAALIHLAREAVGAKQVTPATYATALALFGEEELLHYSVLIASYAQGAILLCIVGQELHDHQSPGLPEQKSIEALRSLIPIMWAAGTGSDVWKRIAALDGWRHLHVVRPRARRHPAIYEVWKWHFEMKRAGAEPQAAALAALPSPEAAGS